MNPLPEMTQNNTYIEEHPKHIMLRVDKPVILLFLGPIFRGNGCILGSLIQFGIVSQVPWLQKLQSSCYMCYKVSI